MICNVTLPMCKGWASGDNVTAGVQDHSGAEGEEEERVWGGCVGRVMCPLTPGVCRAISRLFPFSDYIVI